MTAVVLVGVETVAAAAHRMQDAADRMTSAAARMEAAFDHRQRWEEEYLQRLEGILFAKVTIREGVVEIKKEL